MSENKDINNIANRLANAQEIIAQTSEKFNRLPNAVKLMAVSKTKPNTDIIDAYSAGQRIFGENYAQELHDKFLALNNLKDIEWHYIGPIQSNKTKIVAEAATWVDSVDRIKIAKRLSNHAKELNKELNILLQVNISQSETKSGVLLSEVPEFVSQLVNLDNIVVRGLMAIPDKHEDKQLLKDEFLAMKTCFVTLQQQYSTIDTLSLGMSADMNEAIECGSTMVRIGTAIFGSRN